jgi:hypothetical protein
MFDPSPAGHPDLLNDEDVHPFSKVCAGATWTSVTEGTLFDKPGWMERTDGTGHNANDEIDHGSCWDPAAAFAKMPADHFGLGATH